MGQKTDGEGGMVVVGGGGGDLMPKGPIAAHGNADPVPAVSQPVLEGHESWVTRYEG